MRQGYKSVMLLLLFLGAVFSAYSQEKVVTGTVTDNTGPLPGVSVLIKGSNKGTETDFNGKYTIKAKQGDVLVFSFLSMKTVERTVGTALTIDVQMEEGTNVLDEVVVVAYGTSSVREKTGSISTMKSKVIEDLPVVSFQNTLQGNVSGVLVGASSGQPGSFPSVRIRGSGSLNAGNNPLYVIDGIPVTAGDISDFSTSTGNVLSTLNPADIENVTVLKDAASASLYGSRAANGVILITTKQGKQGKTTYSFRTTTGVSEIAMKDIGRKPVDGDTYRELSREGLYNLFFYVQGRDQATSNTLADQFLGSIFPIPAGGYTNWEDILFRTGDIQTYDLSARGGSEKTKFFASMSYTDQEAVIYQSSFKRYSFRTNIEHKSSDKLKFGINNYLGFTNQNRVPDQAYYFANPTYMYIGTYTPLNPVRDANGDLLPNIAGSFPNPLYERGRTYSKTETLKLTLSPWVEYKILPELTFKTSNSFDFVSNDDDLYWSPSSNDGAPNGYRYKSRNFYTTLTTSNTLNYVNTFGEKHNVEVLAGEEYTKTNRRDFNGQARGFPNDVLRDFGTASDYTGIDDSDVDDAILSFFTRVKYNFDNKYYIKGSLRRDGSSRLSKKNRWGTFWSASVAWDISKEDFMKDVSFVDFLKLRSSYGTSGTRPSSLTGYLELYGFSAKYNGQTAAFPSQLANPNLKWETNKNFDVGIDFGFFNNRLSGSLDYYNRKTEDLLQSVPIPSTTGFTTTLQNIGEMVNRGFEISLTSVNIENEDFRWSTTFTGSHNANEITKLYNGNEIQTFPYMLRVGHSRYSFYLRESAGVDPATGRQQWYKNTTDANGNITSGREITTSSSQARSTIVGKWDPDLVGGLRNEFKYKNFDLNVLFNYTIGGQVYDADAFRTRHDGRFPTRAIISDQVDRWQKPGDISKNPIRIHGNATNSNFQSSRRLEDASYVRLKNITLGYSLPASIVKRAHMSNVRLYVTGTNLWTWAKQDLFDPELTGIGGQTSAATPPVKAFTLGAQINF